MFWNENHYWWAAVGGTASELFEPPPAHAKRLGSVAHYVLSAVSFADLIRLFTAVTRQMCQ